MLHMLRHQVCFDNNIEEWFFRDLRDLRVSRNDDRPLACGMTKPLWERIVLREELKELVMGG